jgi:hypothetical protein
MHGAMNECGWAWNVDGNEGMALAIKDLTFLLNHPKLNANIDDVNRYPFHYNWEI